MLRKNVQQHHILTKGQLNLTRLAWRIVVWHARKTTIHCMGASHSLHYRLTKEWLWSGTVVFASIAWSQDISRSNALPPRNARSVEDSTIPCSTRNWLQYPQGLSSLLSLHRRTKTLRLWQCTRHNRAANGKCCSWLVKSLQLHPMVHVPPIKLELCLTLAHLPHSFQSELHSISA